MRYCDLHCDVLTASGSVQATAQRLRAGGCLVQCFAAFVEEGGFSRFSALADAFDALCAREGYRKIVCADDIDEGAVNALFTSEGGAFSTLGELEGMYARGVRIAGFVWNTPTGAGFPNFPDYHGACAGRVPFTLREGERGLTPFGFAAAERMAQLGMLADVSHGSDRLFADVASRGHPFVATHSCAASVHAHARNLSDAQVRTLADSGGVVGLNFCADFLSEDAGAQGQRDALLAHAAAIVRAGGEDVLALGSDFDGIPSNAFLPDPSHMPRLLELFSDAFGARVAQKIACENVLRVLREGLSS